MPETLSPSAKYVAFALTLHGMLSACASSAGGAAAPEMDCLLELSSKHPVQVYCADEAGNTVVAESGADELTQLDALEDDGYTLRDIYVMPRSDEVSTASDGAATAQVTQALKVTDVVKRGADVFARIAAKVALDGVDDQHIDHAFDIFRGPGIGFIDLVRAKKGQALRALKLGDKLTPRKSGARKFVGLNDKISVRHGEVTLSVGANQGRTQLLVHVPADLPRRTETDVQLRAIGARPQVHNGGYLHVLDVGDVNSPIRDRRVFRAIVAGGKAASGPGVEADVLVKRLVPLLTKHTGFQPQPLPATPKPAGPLAHLRAVISAINQAVTML